MTQAHTVIGIDLGGTKIAAARFNAETLEILRSDQEPTNAELTFEYVRGELLQCISELRDEHTIAVGIGVPGPVDAVTKRIVQLPNIKGADGFDLVSYVEEHTGLKTVIQNDSRCFTLAEALLGAGRGHSVVAGVIMGTGVGGGIVIDGKLLEGAHGFAGEFGHMLLVPGSPPYRTDDKRGEVEQFLSGKAMGLRCTQALDPKEYLSGQACAFMHPDIYREVAWFITSLTHAIDPSVVIFGGSAGRALKPHLAQIESELQRWMLPGVPPPRLTVGELEHGSMRGAALLALRKR